MKTESDAFVFGSYPESEDMRAVAAKLHSMAIQHRFVLSGSQQQLVLLNRDDVDLVNEIISQWQSGNLIANIYTAPTTKIRFNHRQAPLTLALLFLGFVGTALAAFGEDFIHLFTFWDFQTHYFYSLSEFNPWIDISQGQFWRLMTPIFLHFGPIHILFNAMWIWYLGSIVELNQGRLVILSTVLLIAIVSNAAQAFVSGLNIFGGLSGVVYGLFAYCWLWGILNKVSSVRLPNVLFVVITVLMLLSPFGLFDIIAGGEVADTAHISGYITGLLIAAVASLILRIGRKIES